MIGPSGCSGEEYPAFLAQMRQNGGHRRGGVICYWGDNLDLAIRWVGMAGCTVFRIPYPFSFARPSCLVASVAGHAQSPLLHLETDYLALNATLEVALLKIV